MKMYQQLQMNRQPISNERQFRKYFSPVDLLGQRQLAAGFAIQNMSSLSVRDSFHSARLYMAVFQNAPVIDRPEEYGSGTPTGLITAEESATIGEIWKILKLDEIKDAETITIFWILTAGYLLAGKNPGEIPISYEAAMNSYNGVAEPHREQEWPEADEMGRFVLQTRETPYVLHLDPQRAAEALGLGGKIVARRLSAAANRHGISDMMALIDIYEGENEPRRIELESGDYLYCSYVGDIPAAIYPVRAVCGDYEMYRNADTIMLTRCGNDAARIDCKGRNVIGFAPDTSGGWLILDEHGLDCSHYKWRKMNETFLWAVDNVVEAAILENGTLVLLDEDGRIKSTDAGHADLAKRKAISIRSALSGKGVDDNGK